MAKAVVKEGFIHWSGYIKEEYVQEIKNRAKEEGRTITYVVNTILSNGLNENGTSLRK